MTGEQILLERGRREGMAKGKAEAVLVVLAARKLPVTDVERHRILTCTDLGQLDRWLDRAATAAFTHDVLAE